MSKAYLMLDEMPDRCGHCRLSAMVKYYAMCMVTGLECAEGGKPDWCPLKPVGGGANQLRNRKSIYNDEVGG